MHFAHLVLHLRAIRLWCRSFPMATVTPFAALRPDPALAAKVCELPYDVMSSAEAKVMADGNPLSFLRVSKPEIDLPDGTDLYSDAVYAIGRENFLKLIADRRRELLLGRALGTHRDGSQPRGSALGARPGPRDRAAPPALGDPAAPGELQRTTARAARDGAAGLAGQDRDVPTPGHLDQDGA